MRFGSAGGSFTVTVALLGPALITAICAARAGRRAAGTVSPIAAWIGGMVATGLASAVVLQMGTSAAASPVAWQAVVLPVVLVAVVSIVGVRSARPGVRPLPAGIIAGLAATALLLAAAAVAVAVLLFVRFADVVGLYESLAAGPAGGFALTVAQILALPTVVVWAASWLLGPGFALGAGSTTGPFAAQLGPLPALPILGAVPADPPSWAAAVLVVPVLAGVAAGVLVRRAGGRTPAVPLGLLAGIVAGLCMGALAAAVSGAAGPGRFAHVGPDALLVAGAAAALIGVPAMLGAAVTRPRLPMRSVDLPMDESTEWAPPAGHRPRDPYSADRR